MGLFPNVPILLKFKNFKLLKYGIFSYPLSVYSECVSNIASIPLELTIPLLSEAYNFSNFDNLSIPVPSTDPEKVVIPVPETFNSLRFVKETSCKKSVKLVLTEMSNLVIPFKLLIFSIALILLPANISVFKFVRVFKYSNWSEFIFVFVISN